MPVKPGGSSLRVTADCWHGALVFRTCPSAPAHIKNKHQRASSLCSQLFKDSWVWLISFCLSIADGVSNSCFWGAEGTSLPPDHPVLCLCYCPASGCQIPWPLLHHYCMTTVFVSPYWWPVPWLWFVLFLVNWLYMYKSFLAKRTHTHTCTTPQFVLEVGTYRQQKLRYVWLHSPTRASLPMWSRALFCPVFLQYSCLY